LQQCFTVSSQQRSHTSSLVQYFLLLGRPTNIMSPQVRNHRPCRGREPCHRLGQGKSGRQRGTATDHMDQRGILDQEDTDVHESGCRILPTQPHIIWDQVISRSRAPSSCKQSRCDQDVRRTSKHCQ